MEIVGKVIVLPIQTAGTCVNEGVINGVICKDPFKETALQGPVDVIVKLKLPSTVLDPEIVKTPLLNTPVTPFGKPETFAPVALPPTLYIIGLIGVLIQIV
jgi:hypothetical protein